MKTSIYRLRRLFIVSVLALSALTALPLAAAPLCSAVFQGTTVPVVEKVSISEDQFNETTQDLRSTLSGKLATVWRSEWKTKLSFFESNQYVQQLTKELLTSESRKYVLNDLKVEQEGFVQQIHARIYDLITQNKIKPKDKLLVRDKPAPTGAKDTTFTYYTKPIVVENAEGKHQMRVRTYLREIIYTDMTIGSTIQGFDALGNTVEFLRQSEDLYKITIKINDAIHSEQHLSSVEMNKRFGKSAHIFAPHGKSFKLEIKTALNDVISDKKLPLLGGNHMVQKLDVSLSPAQVSKLFAPLNGIDIASRQKISLERISEIEKEVNLKTPDNKARTEAVFNVLRTGLLNNNNFLEIEGATFYHRTAFESTSGFQTTIDREQGVFAGQMYSSTSLKSPIDVVRNNSMLKPRFEDARHVELKVPVTSIQKTVGIDFQDPKNAPQPQNTDKESEILKAATIYHQYVKNSSHAGKFNFIRKEGQAENELSIALNNSIQSDIRINHAPKEMFDLGIAMTFSDKFNEIPKILKSIIKNGANSLTSKQGLLLKSTRKKLSIARSILKTVEVNHQVPKEFDHFVRDLGKLNDYISLNETKKAKKLANKILSRIEDTNFKKILRSMTIGTEESIISHYKKVQSSTLQLLGKSQMTVHEYHIVRKNLKEFLNHYYIDKKLNSDQETSAEYIYLKKLNDNLGLFNDHFTKKLVKKKSFNKESYVEFPKELKEQAEHFLKNILI